jgi:hypothetical protein
MTDPTNIETSEETEKREQRARIIGLDVREVSLVDKAANEREFLVVKNLDGGEDMNPETQAPSTVETTEVEKALDLTRQLLVEKGDALKMLVDKLTTGVMSDEEFDSMYDLMYDVRRGRWAMKLAEGEGKAAKPDDYPYPQVKEADAEKAGASLAKIKQLVDKAIGMAGDNDKLAAVLGEVKDMLGEMGKYPYPSKKEEGTMSDAEKKDKVETEETEETEKKDKTGDAPSGDGDKPTETDEEAEKRAGQIDKLMAGLKEQREKLDSTIKQVEGFLNKAEGKPEEEKPEEMKALKATIAEQGKTIEKLTKQLDEIVKTRGASKAVEEPPAGTEETREKSGPVDWSNVL